ncbi:Lariat debranching enzyme B [Phytophthora megakarya]|uniref:Lariat debranching enzyme B n=1 Tax=Phytophthora megakarya TaxID=4795 RepID=A0A225VE13_9STRA|nr:Lariat debranching enzyme B [Phytophthora megakarya]
MVRVAVVGCAHGMLDDIYATVNFVNEMDPENPVELLLCCGDFECIGNMRDLGTLACPPKYRALYAFHRYYKQEKTAPVLTILFGGNHKASGYLKKLYYAGWVAPNMFYLGTAGVINVAGLRIAGLSGIYKQQHHTAGHFELQPFDNTTMRSVYHVREL